MNEGKKTNISGVIEELSGKFDELLSGQIGKDVDVSDVLNLFGISEESFNGNVDKLSKSFNVAKKHSEDVFGTAKDKTEVFKTDFLNKLTDLGFIVKTKEQAPKKESHGFIKPQPKSSISKEFPFLSKKQNDGTVTLSVALGCVDPSYLKFDLSPTTNEVVIVNTKDSDSPFILGEFKSKYKIADSFDVMSCVPTFDCGVVHLNFKPKSNPFQERKTVTF